jgi:hypothetical protein
VWIDWLYSRGARCVDGEGTTRWGYTQHKHGTLIMGLEGRGDGGVGVTENKRVTTNTRREQTADASSQTDQIEEPKLLSFHQFG